jgi:hypothetical protein
MTRIFGRKLLHPLSSTIPDTITQGINRTENVGGNVT